MASLKVFVSSTCYDMHAVRAQLRGVLQAIGYEPVMSDHADVIYDPRQHTHSSCLREVENCDMVVLVVGSRFGGTTIPKALELVELDHLGDLSRADRFREDKTKISITQAETLRAIQTGVPVFAFVDSAVMRDHLTYEKNKHKSIIGEIDFSSIDKSETAPYLFEFINFLRLRNENNSIFEFSRFEDIESQLKRQWAGLFQRLMHEQRINAQESRRLDNLSSQIADLKAAVLGSISNTELKETAKGAIRFRQLIDFVSSVAAEQNGVNAIETLRLDISWEQLFQLLGIADVRSDETRSGTLLARSILVRDDGTFYRVRISPRVIARMGDEWPAFRALGAESKSAIISAVIDSHDSSPRFLVRYYNEQYSADSLFESDEDIALSRSIRTRLQSVVHSASDETSTSQLESLNPNAA